METSKWFPGTCRRRKPRKNHRMRKALIRQRKSGGRFSAG
nr:MAG TPA: hypothetical protein [Caudoviricetes sp.]